MNTFNFRLSTLVLCTALGWGIATSATAQTLGQGPVTLNFVGAEVDAVARTISTITGKNLVVDPRVKGQITLTTEKPVSGTTAYRQFLAALRMMGAAAVEVDGLVKIMPEADAKLQSPTVLVDAGKASGAKIATQIFNLQHASANALVPILKPLISANNVITANTATNSLVITDYSDNLQRLAQIIAASDLPTATDIEIIPVKHGIASDIAALALKLSEGSGATAVAAAADAGFKTTIIPDPRSNSIILRSANQARNSLLKSLIERLDQPTSPYASGNIHVVHLKNADAAKLATTLRAAISATASPSGTVTAPSPTPTAGAGNPTTAPIVASAQPSTGGQIQADPATNSLIITAPEPQYRQMRAVIDQLDERRAQVFVESLIVEINSDKAAELGIQLQGSFGRVGEAILGLLGSNFGKDGNNILTLTAQGIPESGNLPTAVPGNGFNFGVLPRTRGANVLGFLARMLETTGDGNVLSTPNLLTLDNEEARIVIGQNVPFVTGQYTNSTSGGTNPFQTIERKDVGLTLKVKPQISENGTVKLQIFQEVSSVQASSVNSTTGLITNKRSIESNVLVDDGSIVVLGGLMQEEYAGNADKVPVLGDIPLFGSLFKNETRNRHKTNLMIFLRPTVVRDASSTEKLSLDRYQMMRSNQQLAQPGNNFILGINEAPILPANSTHSRLNSIVANEKPESPPAQAVEIPNIKDGR
jgi:general secretion pathway protein D